MHDNVNVLRTTKLCTCKWFQWCISWYMYFTAMCKADAGQKAVREDSKVLPRLSVN